MQVIFTGDLISSTMADPSAIQYTMDSLSRAADVIAGWNTEPAYFTRSRGDGWQVLLQNPRLTLRASLLLFAAAKCKKHQLETRMGIGAGDVTLSSNSLSDASGSALISAGRALDKLKSRQRIGIDGLDTSAHATLIFGAIIASEWTSAQAEAVMHAIDHKNPRTHAQIAKILNLHTNTIQEHLHLSHFSQIEDALSIFETE